MAMLPEIQTLSNLIQGMHESYSRSESVQKSPALNVLLEVWSSNGHQITATTFQEILAISSSPRGFLPFIKGRGAQSIAISAVDAIEACFSSAALRGNLQQWYIANRENVANIKTTISIFDDIDFDYSKVAENSAEINEALGGIRGRLAKLEGLSDASRTVLICQVDLIEKSFTRFQTHGVGAFRESVFSMYGRISVELKAAPDEKVATGLKEAADDLLRVAGLIETASSVLQLIGPAALKLLTGPS
jgi:hypothetical protein